MGKVEYVLLERMRLCSIPLAGTSPLGHPSHPPSPRRPFPARPAPLPAQTARPPTRGLKSFNAPPCGKSSGDPASPFRPRPRPPLTVNFVNYQRDACPAAHVLARFFTANVVAAVLRPLRRDRIFRAGISTNHRGPPRGTDNLDVPTE